MKPKGGKLAPSGPTRQPLPALPARRPANRFTQIFLGLFMAVGLFGIGSGIRDAWRSLACAHWPAVEGVVVSAQLKHHDGRGNGTYAAEISYIYTVAGASFTSTKVAFGEMESSSDHAQATLNRFPVGLKAPVYYSPNHPELAVLEPGIHGGTWTSLGVGTVFVLASWMFLSVQRNRPATPASQPEPRQIVLQSPPKLMGVIFAFAGFCICFMEPSPGTPHWILYAAGGFFIIIGLFILAYKNQKLSKILLFASVLTLLVIFHWVAFGPGERLGTVTTPFSQTSGTSVRGGFAVITLFFDLIFAAFGVQKLIKFCRNK